MKYLSFRTFLICILMPPALYLFTLQGLEFFLQKKTLLDIQQVLFSDTKPLLEGRLSILDETEKNINNYLKTNPILKLGFSAEVLVKTKKGRLIYPQPVINRPDVLGPEPNEMTSDLFRDRHRVAESNWKILQEGIQLLVSVRIPRNSWLANGILTFYIMLFVVLPYRAYLAKTREAKEIAASKKQALEAVNKRLTDAQVRLAQVSSREKHQQQEIKKLKTDLDLADSKVRETEDEALAEIEELDESLNESVKLKEKLEVEVLRLEQELKNIEASHKILPAKQRKQVNNAMRRFKTLYKNLKIHARAIDGFLDLEDNMQLQAEELIHTLNEEGVKIPVKRKVSTKKGNTPVFECEFGRNGRIYWGSGPGTIKQIFVIGTKNSQHRDLAYLDGL